MGRKRIAFNSRCEKAALNVENLVEKVENPRPVPQDIDWERPSGGKGRPYLVPLGQKAGAQERMFLMMSSTVSRRCWSFFISLSIVLSE